MIYGAGKAKIVRKQNERAGLHPTLSVIATSSIVLQQIHYQHHNHIDKDYGYKDFCYLRDNHRLAFSLPDPIGLKCKGRFHPRELIHFHINFTKRIILPL